MTDFLCRVSFWRYRPLKLPLSCEVDPKNWFCGPWFVGGRDSPDFGHAFSNYTYFRPSGRIWFSSVQRARRLADEKKKKERRIPVKYKSARRPEKFHRLATLLVSRRQTGMLTRTSFRIQSQGQRHCILKDFSRISTDSMFYHWLRRMYVNMQVASCHIA